METTNPVNPQITDAVTQTNVPVNGDDVPAMAEGAVEEEIEEGEEKAAGNDSE